MNSSANAHQLSFPRKVGFAFGDYGCNLYWQSISIFLLFYYTDAVGLSAATAGIVYMIATFFDAALDPLMGMIADRTRTKRGRYRPYLLFGAIPLACAFVFMFYKPSLAGTALTLWMLTSHIIFRVAYTVLSIPYTSLNARLTRSSDERGTLAGLRIIFATLAAFTISYTMQPMAARFGEGDLSTGFMFAAMVFAGIATLVFPVVYFSTKEPEETPATAGTLSLKESLSSVINNRAFWVIMLCMVTGAFVSITLDKSLLYYFKYYVQDEAASRISLSINSASGLILVPMWVLIAKRFGKRSSWFICKWLGVIGLLYFIMVDLTTVPATVTFFWFMKVCTIGSAFLFWSMLPDTVEYGEWRSGIRAESFVFGFGQFCLKMALGAAAGIFGVLLDTVGYVANETQSADTLAGMKTIMIILPMAGLLTGIAAMLLHPLKRGVHESIVEQLAERQAASP